MLRNLHVDARALAVAVVVSLLTISVATPFAAGAGQTTVAITPSEQSVDVSESVTYEVVVDSAQGGVGAAELRVSVADANVAKIVDATVLGSGATNKDVASDGSFVDLEWAFRDTADSGTVTVAEVTVEGTGAGTTALGLQAVEGNDAILVFDEGGTGYDVTDTSEASVTVEGQQPSPPATFQVSNLQAPSSAQQGDDIDVAADIENTGGQTATKSVEFRVDTDGDGAITDESAVVSQDVELDPGESTTVTFEDIDTSGLSVGTLTHGVATPDDSETAQIEITVEAPKVGDFPTATDPDGDGKYEDINGNGEANVVDVQALFANLDELEQSNLEEFDFNNDGKVDVVDVQKLFVELTGGS